MPQNGKGSTPRPFTVDHDTYASNWDRIFGAKPNTPKPTKMYAQHCQHCGELFRGLTTKRNWSCQTCPGSSK